MSTSAPNASQFKKYLFKGEATALRGSIRKPYFQELGSHLSASTYAGAPANIRCTNQNFAFGGVISYASASTSVIAVQQGSRFDCTVTAEIEGLRVGKRLSVGKIVSRLHSVYDSGAYPGNMIARVSPAGSTIEDLRIDDKPLDLKLPTVFGFKPDREAEYLTGRAADNAFAPDISLIPPPFYIPDFGTIFYAEWAFVHPDEKHRHHLTMLRLALGSDFGADVDCGCTDNDGSGWPPRST